MIVLRSGESADRGRVDMVQLRCWRCGNDNHQTRNPESDGPGAAGRNTQILPEMPLAEELHGGQYAPNQAEFALRRGHARSDKVSMAFGEWKMLC